MSAQLARSVAHSVPAVLVYLDAKLRILFASDYCRQLFGYAPLEILGRSLSDMVDPRTLRYVRGHAASLARGNTAPYEYVLRHKDGSLRRYRVNAIPDRGPEGQHLGFFACTSDGALAVGSALHRVGPELRTPLASVIAALELLREGVDRGSGPERDQFLALALENADRLAARIEALLKQDRH